MEYPVSDYVEQDGDGLYVAGSGVSLDSVVIHFQHGSSPEGIIESFPTLKLSQVYGVIAYYLEHEQLVKDYLAETKRRFEALVPPLSVLDPALYARLEAAREKMGLNRA